MGSLGRGRSSHGTPGFTLVEILVVIIVLGIVAGVAIALVNPDERDVSAREARRFAGALEYAAQRAQWRDEMLGVSADRRVLRYWRRDTANDRWLIVDDDDILRAHALPDPVDAMALAYAGRGVASNAIVPLRASGRNEPFAFLLATPRYRTVITLDPLNRVAIAGPVPVNP
ncbi:MAG: type II secretion system protein [Burkholderiales bacterium]|jgi:type II secretion system protein H